MHLPNFREYQPEIDSITKCIAVFTIILYISGFIVINSYLSKFGVGEYSFGSARYVFAGASFAVFSAIWWIFVGRPNVTEQKWNDLPFSADRIGMSLLRINVIYSYAIRLLYASLYSAFILFGLDGADLGIFVIFSTTSGIILFIEQQYYRFLNWKFIYFFLMFFLKTMTIILFLQVLDFHSILAKVILSYIGVSFVFIGVQSALKENIFFELSQATSAPFQIIATLGMIISFGSLLYPYTRLQYGGMKPHPVTITTKEDSYFLDRKAARKDTVNSILLYQGDKFLLIELDGKYLTLQLDQVKYVTFSEEKKEDSGEKFLATFRSFARALW